MADFNLLLIQQEFVVDFLVDDVLPFSRLVNEKSLDFDADVWIGLVFHSILLRAAHSADATDTAFDSQMNGGENGVKRYARMEKRVEQTRVVPCSSVHVTLQVNFLH